MNEYLDIDSGGYLCTNSLHTLIAAWLDTSMRSQESVRMNMSTRGVKCKALSAILKIGYCIFKELTFTL